MKSISVFVPGRPATKGSARAFVVKGRAVVTNDSARAKSWQGVATSLAMEAWGDRPPTNGAVTVEVHVYLERPKSHYGRRQGQPWLKESAPFDCLRTPDVDKVARVCLDALTGVVYADDRQVTILSVSRHWVGIGSSVTAGVAIRAVAWTPLEAETQEVTP